MTPGVNVTLLPASNPGGAVFTGDLPSRGQHRRRALPVTVSKAGVGYQFLATFGWSAQLAHEHFNVVPNGAATIVVTTQPPVLPAVRDRRRQLPGRRQGPGQQRRRGHYRRSGDAAPRVEPGRCFLTGNTTVLSNVAGNAVFSVSVDRAGVLYQLLATSPGLRPSSRNVQRAVVHGSQLVSRPSADCHDEAIALAASANAVTSVAPFS